MSYDLLVFEPEAAPRGHQDFLDWYRVQRKWSEHRSYADPAVASARLRGWYVDMTQHFPPLNGVFSEEDSPIDDGDSYRSLNRQTSRVGRFFAWSKAEDAYKAVCDLAAQHQLGFFNVSSTDEEVWLPNGTKLALAHARTSLLILKRIRRLLRRS